MKQRNAVTSLVLSLLVPFYTYYWWYDTGKGMRRDGVREVPSIAPLIVAMALYIFGTLAVVMFSILSIINSSAAHGAATTMPSSIFLVYALLPIMWGATFWYAYRFSKAASTVVPLGMSPGLMTLIFVLIAAVGVYLIQDQINLRLAQPQNPPQPPA